MEVVVQVAIDPRRRARQLARKAAKQKAQHDQKRKQGRFQGAWMIMQAANAPIHQALMARNMFDLGLGNVVLSRKKGETIWTSVFLVDVFCLGVKDAFVTSGTEAEYEHLLRRLREKAELKAIHQTCARKLVEGAVAYAKDLGLSPHNDYHKAKKLFGDIDSGACPESFEFGKNGKPMFMSGPYDSEIRRRQIMNQLSRRCGSDGFHYMMGMGNPNFDEFEEDEIDEGEP
jgi:hypothetical protein